MPFLILLTYSGLSVPVRNLHGFFSSLLLSISPQRVATGKTENRSTHIDLIISIRFLSTFMSLQSLIKASPSLFQVLVTRLAFCRLSLSLRTSSASSRLLRILRPLSFWGYCALSPSEDTASSRLHLSRLKCLFPPQWTYVWSLPLLFKTFLNEVLIFEHLVLKCDVA